MFAEALPADCPPSDACETDGITVYRLVEAMTPSAADFDSYAAKWPDRFGTQCKHFAVSVFTNRESLARLLQMPRHANKRVARLTLDTSSGRVYQTGNDPTHYSWWRYAGFDAVAACEVEE